VKRDLTFVDGIGVGLGGLMMLPLIYFMVARGGFLDIYKDMGPSAKLPSLTILVLANPVWGYGVPILLGLAFAFAIWRRPNRWLIFVVGVVALVASIVTYYGAYLPIWQLAGNIP
jgi:hypothetical protein